MAATTAFDRPIRAPRSAAHRLVVGASLTAVGADLALMALIGEVIPPLLVFAVATLAAIALAGRRPGAGLTLLGVLALVAAAGSAPFLASDLSSPADPVAFVYAVLSGGGRVVAVIGAVLARGDRDLAARRVAGVSVAVLALAVAGSLMARATVDSASRQADDVMLTARDFTFPDTVEVASGGVLFVENQDVLRHTFTVEGTDVDVALHPRVQRRVTVDLPPGTYTFLCTVPGHEAMTGTLEVQ